MQEERRKVSFLDRIAEWGSIVITLVSLIFAAGSVYTMYKQQEPRLCKVEEKCESISEMKTNIVWIMKSIDRIEKKIDRR